MDCIFPLEAQFLLDSQEKNIFSSAGFCFLHLAEFPLNQLFLLQCVNNTSLIFVCFNWDA